MFVFCLNKNNLTSHEWNSFRRHAAAVSVIITPPAQAARLLLNCATVGSRGRLAEWWDKRPNQFTFGRQPFARQVDNHLNFLPRAAAAVYTKCAAARVASATLCQHRQRQCNEYDQRCLWSGKWFLSPPILIDLFWWTQLFKKTWILPRHSTLESIGGYCLG